MFPPLHAVSLPHPVLYTVVPDAGELRYPTLPCEIGIELLGIHVIVGVSIGAIVAIGIISVIGIISMGVTVIVGVVVPIRIVAIAAEAQADAQAPMEAIVASMMEVVPVEVVKVSVKGTPMERA